MVKIVNGIAVGVFLFCAAILCLVGGFYGMMYAADMVLKYGASAGFAVLLLTMLAAMVVGVFTS